MMIFPAQIGILASGQAGDLACAFVAHLLSDEGQRVLLDPAIGRVPISRTIHEADPAMYRGNPRGDAPALARL
ncbi:MAG: hypothetical protein HPM95_06710 [Alphaproteobacteria bacterium]|nr:hypothetical protein [Alphaproteobacteria bacterium]